MRSATPLHRVAAAVAIAGMLAGPLPGGLVSGGPAMAQPAPVPPGAPPRTRDAAALADPPAVVGRLARLSGTVSFRTADEDHWNPATVNYPVTAANSIWTEPHAEADIEIGPSLLALDGASELDIDGLDDLALTATLAQGRLFLHLRDRAAGSVVTVRTPRGTVSIGQAGRYLVVAGDATAPTLVTVAQAPGDPGSGDPGSGDRGSGDRGTAQVYAEGMALTVGAGQTATVTGSGAAGDALTGVVGPQEPDPFLDAWLARERPRPAAGVAPPPVVLQMTGAAPLLDTGEWAETRQYGRVWFPPVAADWVPYRNGRWVWASPWGWTWVDDAPWGFAPSHYGRWAAYDGRWAWVPGAVASPPHGPPVYAPALVSWVDVAGGAAVGGAAALAIGAAVGWIPLGPREPYRPWYRASPGYVGRVNNMRDAHVTNITNVNTLVNCGAGSFGTEGGIAGPHNPGRWQGMTPEMVAAARPVVGPRVRPSLATPGITPAVARQVSLAPAPLGVGPPPISPGPAVRARPAGAEAPLPGHPPGGPGVAAGVGAVAGGAAAFRPGLPALAPQAGMRPASAGQAPIAPGPAGAGHRPGITGGQPPEMLSAPLPAAHHPGPATFPATEAGPAPSYGGTAFGYPRAGAVPMPAGMPHQAGLAPPSPPPPGVLAPHPAPVRSLAVPHAPPPRPALEPAHAPAPAFHPPPPVVPQAFHPLPPVVPPVYHPTPPVALPAYHPPPPAAPHASVAPAPPQHAAAAAAHHPCPPGRPQC